MCLIVSHADIRKFELEDKIMREDEIAKLRLTMQAAIATARAEGERTGREFAFQDLGSSNEKTWEGIQQAHLKQIQLVRDVEYKRGLKDGQLNGMNEKRLQSLTVSVMMEQEGSSTHSSSPNQSALQVLQHTSAVSKPFENFVVPSISASSLVGDLNVTSELESLSQSPGCETIPSRLSVFSHAFLNEIFGSSDCFWKSMQLALEIMTRKKNPAGWSRILKIHNNREPHVDFKKRPSIGKHGAILLIRYLDDTFVPEAEYPTFVKTVEGHAAYAGNYKVVKQHVRDSPVNLFGVEFVNYLLEYEKGKRFIQETTGHRIISEPNVLAAFENGVIQTSWIVLEYIGFDLKGYGSLLSRYSQIEPFCRLKRGIPLQNVVGGFEHTLMNEIMKNSSKQKVDKADEGNDGRRKRRKIAVSVPLQPYHTLDESQHQNTPRPRSCQQLKNESTIVVDSSPSRS